MIHPRRLKGKPGNIVRYYTVGDYYTKGAEEHSEWGGHIASELGLQGPVEPALFRSLLAGHVGDQRLGRHRADGEIEHHPGWDFAVNAPKSVSVMALVAGDARILDAHERAVGAALSYLEEHAALRHRSEGKVVHETTGRLVFARFTEHASRELDPHLHTHVVVMNITGRGDDSPFASLETRAMFAEQMVAGQVYRNELAHGLRSIGYTLTADSRRGLFEIEGVPKDLIEAMSRRAQQIEAHAREHGLSGQAARRISFYATRGGKERTSLETLREQWTGRLGAHREVIDHIRYSAEGRGDASPTSDPATSARAMLFGLRQEEGREAVNSRGRLLARALASHVGEVRLSDIRPLVETHENQRKLLSARVQTGDEILVLGRTSRRTARLELILSDHLALALDDARPISTEVRLRSASSAIGLSGPQEAALIHVGTSADRIVGIHGVAGAGKSTLVKALASAADEDLTLIGIAPTSSAAANLGASAGMDSRTVASLLASGGRTLDDGHVLVLDEAGQLGNRQALRVLELSRVTGARLILLGDNSQTGAIEQGKPFWLMQRLGLSRADLTESVRQETKAMKAAVTQARAHDYAASLENLDKVVSGQNADRLAADLVSEWTRLKPETRATTNILVLENSTRHIVNTKIREALKSEGVIAAQEARLSVLLPSGMSEQEKRFARFYSGGQVLSFSRGHASLGLARDTEYRVIGVGRDVRGRQIVQLIDENGRTINWDPRLSRATQVNVFKREERDLAEGDRIQWRLVNRDLGVRNADRGTVQRLEGALATIRWDRDGRAQEVDLSLHKTWDHGYAETVFSSQSKTYDRVYVLAPVASPLVTGQNYYTAITRARFGVKLWTEDEKRLVGRLERRLGEKTSALEGLGRLDRDSIRTRSGRQTNRIDLMRVQQRTERQARKAQLERERNGIRATGSMPYRLAENARTIAVALDRWIAGIINRSPEGEQASSRGNPVRGADVSSTSPPRNRGGPRHER